MKKITLDFYQQQLVKNKIRSDAATIAKAKGVTARQVRNIFNGERSDKIGAFKLLASLIKSRQKQETAKLNELDEILTTEVAKSDKLKTLKHIVQDMQAAGLNVSLTVNA